MTTLILDAPGQQVEHAPDRPIAAAAWVLADGDGNELDSGAAVVNPTVLTLDAPAGWSTSSATKIPVASTTGAEADLAWLSADEGIGEQVEILGWVDDEFLRVKRPLTANYAAGATVQALKIRASIDDAVTSNEELLARRLVLTWSYDLDGAPRRVPQAVIIRRRSSGDTASAAAIQWAGAHFPEINDQARSNGNELDTFAAFAVRAVEDQLRSHGPGIVPEDVLMGPRAPEAIGLKLLVIAAENGLHPARVELESWRTFVNKEYGRVYAAITVGTMGADAFELDDDGKIVTDRDRPGLDFSW